MLPFKQLQKIHNQLLHKSTTRKHVTKPLVVDFTYCEQYEPGELVAYCDNYWFDMAESPHETLIKTSNEITAYGIFIKMSTRATDFKLATILIGDKKTEVFLYQLRPVDNKTQRT